MAELKAIIHASELLTGAGIRAKDGRKVQEEDLGRIKDGAVVYRSGKIVWVGATRDLPKKYAKVRRQNLKGERAIVPGLVDCHTHLVFAGDRAGEFAERCGGATYEQIAAKGGGILTSVRATREASEAELLRLGQERLREAYSWGVRTIEIKTGYGLSHESELKVLRVIRQLAKELPKISVQATYLGAHALPKEMPREDYIREMLERTLPEVAKRKLADACDVFIDEGYFTVKEARRILKRAQTLGLKTKVHADELGDTSSARFAASIGALSADHLLRINEQGIRALAKSETVAVLLPATAFYLRAEHAPARRLIEAGAVVALSTDFNPGTSMTLSLPFVMTLAALYLGMSRAEILAATTYNAAKALGLHARKGTLEPGQDADFWIMPFARFEECYYRFAWAPNGR